MFNSRIKKVFFVRGKYYSCQDLRTKDKLFNIFDWFYCWAICRLILHLCDVFYLYTHSHIRANSHILFNCYIYLFVFFPFADLCLFVCICDRTDWGPLIQLSECQQQIGLNLCRKKLNRKSIFQGIELKRCWEIRVIIGELFDLATNTCVSQECV